MGEAKFWVVGARSGEKSLLKKQVAIGILCVGETPHLYCGVAAVNQNASP